MRVFTTKWFARFARREGQGDAQPQWFGDTVMAIDYEKGSSNVFADLGFPDAGEHQMKAWIVTHILRAMRGQELTQTEAAKRMGLKQPDLSAVLRGRFRGYSVERLARCLSALGDEVRLTVKSKDGAEDNFVLDAV